MIQILNRIGWIVSIALWIAILWIFNIWESSLIWWALLGAVIKWLVFSQDYIQERVEHFSRVQKQRVLGNSHEIETLTSEHKTDAHLQDEKHSEELSSSVTMSKNTPIIHETKDIKTDSQQEEQEENIIHAFFSENILAKLWGIFVFLWVIFLLSLVWNNIPEILKLLIWFLIAWLSYFSWMLMYKKGSEDIARILLWIWLLINYAVILAWRYLLWDIDPFLSIGMSFFLLILNTLFAVATALHYRSEPLLIFAFLCAYLNPFLVGLKESGPELQVWYALIISLGALLVAKLQSISWIIIACFVLGNILIWFAPNTTSESWQLWYTIKFIASIFLSGAVLFSAIKMNVKQKYYIELLFSLTLCIVWLFWIYALAYRSLDPLYFYMVCSAAAIFIGWSYYHMKSWPALYTIGSIGGIFILWTQISWHEMSMEYIYILVLTLYLFTNICAGVLLKPKNLTQLKHLIIWSISAISFIWYIIYSHANVFEISSQIVWYTYLPLALVYSLIAYLYYRKYIRSTEKASQDIKKNILYNYAWIAITILSIAIALIFWNMDFVVWLFWMFESAILIFFYKKIRDIKVLIASLILMFLWVWEWCTSILGLESIMYYTIPAILMLMILLWNSLEMNKSPNSDCRVVHDLIHIIWIAWIFVWIAVSLESDKDLILLLSTLLLCVLAYFYKRYGSLLQKNWCSIIFALLWLVHIFLFWDKIYNSVSIDTTIFQYLITLAYAFSWFVYISTLQSYPKAVFSSRLIYSIALPYLFIITSMYVYHLFQNTFAITLYWGIIAFILMTRWISKDIIRFRTLGLYLISLISIKIFLIDITTWINQAVIKVIAFIAVWVMLIVIGTMYSRKYGSTLKWELDITNIIWSNASNK